MADLFISYARADQPFAERLAALMEQQGWSVWWDRDLVPGNIFDEVIERELGLASAVLVLWSSASVRSQWVRSEASLAAERGNLIPVLTDSTAMPLRFRNLQAVDLSEWDGSATDGRLGGSLPASSRWQDRQRHPPSTSLPPSRLRRPAPHASPGRTPRRPSRSRRRRCQASRPRRPCRRRPLPRRRPRHRVPRHSDLRRLRGVLASWSRSLPVCSSWARSPPWLSSAGLRTTRADRTRPTLPRWRRR